MNMMTRCAIYTRKSTDEGLDQAFNSLDAQREACEAYISSQKHEGWLALDDHYDDGGFSGATMDRPAISELLDAVIARKIDVIVVYKVDRLTRSLADFAKIIEILDNNEASFVSVTQQFNTTTSMGRLTLNVLLSFAQYEREVTAERIRDKIAASKKKGMWMGGLVPLGYDVIDRKLVVNEAEAISVRTLFELYLQHGTVTELKYHADARGLVTKLRKANKNGERHGGEPFTRGHLYKLLSNPIYTGQIRHKEKCYPGEHQAIIDDDLWQQVRQKLAGNAPNRSLASNSKTLAPLAGLLRDGESRNMRSEHSNKKAQRRRYYVSRNSDPDDTNASRPWRLPAPTIERAVLHGVKDLLTKIAMHAGHASLSHLSAEDWQTLKTNRQKLATSLDRKTPAELKHFFTEVFSEIVVNLDGISLKIRSASLLAQLGIDCAAEQETVGLVHHIPMEIRKRGVETKLVLADPLGSIAEPDAKLVRLIAKAQVWFEELKAGQATSIEDISKRNGVHRTDIGKALPLAFLAPDIVARILDGTQPVDLTATRLRRLKNLPFDWEAQRQLLGFK